MTDDDRNAQTPVTSDPHTIEPDPEPVFTGTVFLTFVLLVIIGGVWVVMYRLLLNR
jgi:hypothetical protein